jgi:choline dehydrogenase-like flavoprotein
MLKVAARFDEPLFAEGSVLPLIQVKEFWPEISFGGAFFSSGHLALLLSDNWRANQDHMLDLDRMAAFYVGIRGSGRGFVRPSPFGAGETRAQYDLTNTDVVHLSKGLARLASLLLAAGAREVYPCVFGLPVIRTSEEAARWLDERLPRRALSLTTVHAFSSCPVGERAGRCAADSYGKMHGFDNLFVNDASMLPDSPGVNPQGTVMALARRNAWHFLGRTA